MASANDPVPLSFPAFLLLRPPNSRSLRQPTRQSQHSLDQRESSVTRNVKETPIGKRRQRRLDNVPAQTNAILPSDYHPIPVPKRNYLPPLPNNNSSSIPQPCCPDTAANGLFKMSRKGMRKEMRLILGRGDGRPSVISLINTIESELRGWLRGDVPSHTDRWVLEGRLVVPPLVAEDGKHVENGILESQRSDNMLTWEMEDAFVRYITHCTALYLDVASFSKTVVTSGEGGGEKRITLLMRPPRLDLSSGNIADSIVHDSGSELYNRSINSSFSNLSISSSDDSYLKDSVELDSLKNSLIEDDYVEVDNDIDRTPRPNRIGRTMSRDRASSGSRSPARSPVRSMRSGNEIVEIDRESALGEVLSKQKFVDWIRHCHA